MSDEIYMGAINLSPYIRNIYRNILYDSVVLEGFPKESVPKALESLPTYYMGELLVGFYSVEKVFNHSFRAETSYKILQTRGVFFFFIYSDDDYAKFLLRYVGNKTALKYNTLKKEQPCLLQAK